MQAKGDLSSLSFVRACFLCKRRRTTDSLRRLQRSGHHNGYNVHRFILELFSLLISCQDAVSAGQRKNWVTKDVLKLEINVLFANKQFKMTN